MGNEEQKILFFDGVCGLCNGAVDFVLAHEKNEFLKFSPLQSDFAIRTLPAEFTQNLGTLVLMSDRQFMTKSDAALEIFKLLGWPWSLISIFKLLPKFFRDFLYDQVARTRYTIFGKKDSCRLPTANEKSRFIL
jgi:predicted DCC family thiol-disulfide oxidoreductase YuxK